MDVSAIVAEIKRSTDTFGPYIRTQAEQIPDRTALKFERETLTYGEFNSEVNRVAAALRAAGIGTGDPVAILCQNSPRFLTALGAVAKLGAIAALLNTHLTGDGLTHVLASSTARVGITDAAALPSLAGVSGQHQVRLLVDAPAGSVLPSGTEPLLDHLPDHAPEPDIPEIRNGDVFLYIYTSGTTGYPKPAIVRHIRFTMGGVHLSSLLGIEAGETIYAPLPLYHGESLFVGFAPAFRVGGAFASRAAFSASEFLSDVRRHEAVAFVYVGELCRYLLRQPPSPADRDHQLRVAAGAGLRPDVWTTFQERFGIPRIVEMYGATEGNVALQNDGGPPGSVGKPHEAMADQVALVRYDMARGDVVRDAAGRCTPCEPDEAGELLGRIGVGGSMDYDGYTDHAATRQKLLHDVFEPGDAWFRTGDLLKRDRDGWFYFVDRIGDTFRWKGENVATQEVADVLNEAPGVSETTVYGVELPGSDGRAGMAAVVLASGAAFDGAAFHARAAAHLPPYARPAFVRVAEAIEVTGTLKQRKRHLSEQGWDPARVSDPLFVRDDDAATYVPLTPALAADVRAGRHRL